MLFFVSNFVASAISYCSDPGTPANGHREDQLLREQVLLFPPGKTVSYYCDYTYRLVGPQKRTCLADGSWSAYQPSCQSKYGRNTRTCVDSFPTGGTIFLNSFGRSLLLTVLPGYLSRRNMLGFIIFHSQNFRDLFFQNTCVMNWMHCLPSMAKEWEKTSQLVLNYISNALHRTR